MTATKQIDSLEWAAIVASCAILLVTLGYWVVQIDGVRETLKLAYG